jgi:hydroxypyruvate isomerase
MSNIKQSFAWWSFSHSVDDPISLLRSARRIGYRGVELVPTDLWPVVLESDQLIVTESAGSIIHGLNRIENHSQIQDEVLHKLELASEYGILNLIVFSGNRDGLDDIKGAENTIQGLRLLAPAAEEKGVCLVLELLNSKVDHPDYQCDHTEWAVNVVSLVNSPNVKILYDIYHMQIMEGDVIRTIRKSAHHIGHIHTAGNPGRRDLDGEQELNYPPIIKALHEVGFSGFIGQEFMPKGDPVTALENAYRLCEIQ